MLGTLRKGAHSFFAKALMGLLVLSFGAWGIGDILRTGGTGGAAVATVGDADISQADFLNEMEKLKRSFGENFSPELLKSLNLYSIKMSELINRQLIKQEVKRLGISVSDEDLVAEISRDPEFRNANGEFDKPLFIKTLQQNRVNEKLYMESVRTEMEVRILLNTFTQYSLVPPELVDALYARQHEQRQVALFTITKPATAPKAPEQDGEALHSFYEAHKTSYVAPEYRSIGYLEISPEEILKTVDVSRQELFDTYSQRTDEFTLPEQRDVEQLLYEDKASAEIAYGMLRASKSMEDILNAVPPAEGKATSLGLKSKDVMPAGGDEVFSLDKGEFTYPIQSPFGWHIFIVKDIKQESTAPFDTVKDDLKNELTTQRANTQLADLLEQFEDALSGGQTPQEAATSVGLTYKNTDPLDRFGLRSDKSVALESKAYDAMLATAFSLVQGERSELINQPDGSYYMVQVDSVTPPRERTFEEVQGQVSEDYAASQSHQAVEAYAKDVATSLRQIQPNQDIADDLELSLARIEGTQRQLVTLTRNGAADKKAAAGLEAQLSSGLLEHIFSLKHEQEVTDPYPFQGGYAIGVLKTVIPAPSATETPEGRKMYKAVKRSLREDYRNELLDEYLRYLRTQYPVTVNEEVIQSLMEKRDTP